MRAIWIATLVVVLCGQADAQFRCYKSDVAVTGYVRGTDGQPTIGTVTVPIVLVANQPPGSERAAYSGGGFGPNATTAFGTTISPTAFSASISEHPIAPGAIMTILKMNVASGSLRQFGHDVGWYEGTPPLSGIVTMSLVGGSVLTRFPATITLTPDTISVLP